MAMVSPVLAEETASSCNRHSYFDCAHFSIDRCCPGIRSRQDRGASLCLPRYAGTWCALGHLLTRAISQRFNKTFTEVVWIVARRAFTCGDPVAECVRN